MRQHGQANCCCSASAICIKACAGGWFGAGNHHRHAPVAAFADFGEDRHFAQERDVLARGLRLPAAVAEDLDPLARRAW